MGDLDLFGVPVRDRTMEAAIDDLFGRFDAATGETTCVYFVNAHTLNLAVEQPGYRALLARGNVVYGDGAGVALASRILHGRLPRDNVNGTDLVPLLLGETRGRERRYFLLGNSEEGIARAAEEARRRFPNWVQAGFHHGYLDDDAAIDAAIAAIHEARPDLLLVGMGNPLQEQWIDRHRERLRVPVAMGIGGLMDYWVGRIHRAPRWVRALRGEWLWLLLQQPHKARRYLLGNPLFVLRVLRERARRGRPAVAP